MRLFPRLCLFWCLASCAVGPDYAGVPNVADNEEETFLNAPGNASGGEDMTRWWERLDDPLLNEYVETLLEENLSLKEASERMLQAQARASIQRGGYFPSVNADNSATRSFQPINGFAIPGIGGGGNERFFNTLYDAGLNISWEIDLFGRIRRANESAQANFVASAYDRQALEQSLIADLLSRRVAIAVNSRLLELAQENAHNQNAIYQLVRRRYDLGASTTTLSDVYLAKENYHSTKADIASFEQALAEETYRLDVLLGKKPGSTTPNHNGFSLLAPPSDAMVCVPATLLDRRPDLRAAELRAVAANADIGVAIADLYPAVSLGGTIGVTGNTTNNLLSADQLAGSLLGNITGRIFEGGALRANIRLQEAEAREAAAAYANNVLEAMREVETALSAEMQLARQITQLGRSVKALRRAETLTEKRYRSGIETLREFLETQQRRYQVEQNFLRTQQEKWQARINLYLALGGDWFNDQTKNTSNACQPNSNQKDQHVPA